MTSLISAGDCENDSVAKKPANKSASADVDNFIIQPCGSWEGEAFTKDSSLGNRSSRSLSSRRRTSSNASHRLVENNNGTDSLLGTCGSDLSALHDSENGIDATSSFSSVGLGGGGGEKRGSVMSSMDIEIATEESPRATTSPVSRSHRFRGRHIIYLTILSILAFFVYEALASGYSTESLLEWVKKHPKAGVLVMVVGLTLGPLMLVPVAGPLGMGCGYVYTAAYGWSYGFPLAAAVMFSGTITGASSCFFTGRYLMRDQVRKWIQGNHLLEAVDIASAESGFKIMAMLDLAPLPLGPLSYVCGTTSMTFTCFCTAKIFALPRTVLTVFAGASTTTLLGAGKSEEEALHTQILMGMGLVLAGVVIALLGHNIRNELNKILERQAGGGLRLNRSEINLEDMAEEDDHAGNQVEFGSHHPRHRKNSINIEMEPLRGNER